MKFEEVENLNSEEVMSIYDDILVFDDDDTRLARCCCYGDSRYGFYYRHDCLTWCRVKGYACFGWVPTEFADCVFSC